LQKNFREQTRGGAGGNKKPRGGKKNKPTLFDTPFKCVFDSDDFIPMNAIGKNLKH